MTSEVLKRDPNHVTVLGGVTDNAAQEVTMLRVDPTTKRLMVSATGLPGGGDVTGPASSTDNAVVLFNGTDGKTIKNSTIKLVTTVFSPTVSDGVSLGSTSLPWSDLFMASGSVINLANDWVATHTAAILTVGTGDLRVTTAGTNSASVVTVGGTQTLTSKILTSPTLTTPSLGVATATSINGLTITTTTGVLTMTNAKTLAVTNSLTLSGTDSTVMTFPTTTATIARTDAGQTFTGVQVFTSPTITTANLSGAQQLAEGASIRLDAVLSADGTYSGTGTIAGTAGTTLAFGDLVYLAVADTRWELTDADSVTTCGEPLTGMCVLAAANDGDPTVILLQGNIRADANFPALTVGAPVYASTTPGDIQVAQPSGTDDVIHVVGKALTADSIYFNPSMDYITHT